MLSDKRDYLDAITLALVIMIGAELIGIGYLIYLLGKY